jgi:hypothetical protein
MAGVALVAAVDAVLCLNGSFGHRRGTAPDPEATFEIAIGNRALPGVEQTHWRLGGDQS